MKKEEVGRGLGGAGGGWMMRQQGRGRGGSGGGKRGVVGGLLGGEREEYDKGAPHGQG